MKKRIASLLILSIAPALVIFTMLTSSKAHLNAEPSAEMIEATEEVEEQPKTVIETINVPVVSEASIEAPEEQLTEFTEDVDIETLQRIEEAKADPLYVEVPQEIVELTERVGAELDICPELLQSIIFRESGFDAKSSTGSCEGYMQVMEKYVTDRVNELGGDIYDGYTNVRIGGEILLEKLEIADGDLYLAMMFYHGESNARAKRESGSTSKYAITVVERAKVLERAHGK